MLFNLLFILSVSCVSTGLDTLGLPWGFTLVEQRKIVIGQLYTGPIGVETGELLRLVLDD